MQFVVGFHTLLRDCSSQVVIVSWVNIVDKRMCFLCSLTVLMTRKIWYARTDFTHYFIQDDVNYHLDCFILICLFTFLTPESLDHKD